MDQSHRIPELLLPLREETRVLEGGDEALRVSIALREALRDEASCVVVRVRPDSAVAQVTTVEGVFFVKAFAAGRMARFMPRRFCASASEWQALWACRDKGIPCCRPVAWLAFRGEKGVHYTVAERVANAQPLAAYLERERARLNASPATLRRLATSLAAFVSSLHYAGLLAQHLNAGNLLIRSTRGRTELFEFFLQEVGGEPRHGVPPEGARFAALGELALGFADWPMTLKLRFLREYRGEAGESERAVLREISEAKMRRRFEINTARVASCGEATSAQARLEIEGWTLLLNRGAPGSELEKLEEPLAGAPPGQWEQVLMRHFGARLGEGDIFRIESDSGGHDNAQARRRLESIWGRMLEMDALGVHVPLPLACIVTPLAVVALGRIQGRIEALTRGRDDRDFAYCEILAKDLLRLHAGGCFILPMEAEELLAGLCVCVTPRLRREPLLAAPNHFFRGTPTVLGQQAIASLGRASRAVALGLGERAMKELVWSYARLLRLAREDSDMLFEEAARVPTGRTLVMTRGIERGRATRGVAR